MEDSIIMNPINRVLALVEEFYPDVRKCLASLFGREVSTFILESIVLNMLSDMDSSVSHKKAEDFFIRALNKEIRRILRLPGGPGGPLLRNPEKLPDGCSRYISKQTIRKICSGIKTGYREESGIKGYDASGPDTGLDIAIDFDAFKTRIIERQMKLESDYVLKKKRKRLILALLGPVLAVVFLFAVFLSSFKPLISGDITYGIAVKRFFAGFPMIKRIEDREPKYLTWTEYETKEQLQDEHPDAFILIPPVLPEGYTETKFIYMTHSNGYTTAVVFNITDFASFTIEYAVRDDYDPLSYRTLFYEYEIVQEGEARFYLFKESNYGFTAAFFLDDIYVVIKGQRNYKGTNTSDLVRLVSGIMHEYYGTVTD